MEVQGNPLIDMSFISHIKTMNMIRCFSNAPADLGLNNGSH